MMCQAQLVNICIIFYASLQLGSLVGQLVFALTCTHAYYLQLMLANNQLYSPEYIQYEHYSLQIRIFVYKKMGERKLDFLSASRVYEPKFARGCMPIAHGLFGPYFNLLFPCLCTKKYKFVKTGMFHKKKKLKTKNKLQNNQHIDQLYTVVCFYNPAVKLFPYACKHMQPKVVTISKEFIQ